MDSYEDILYEKRYVSPNRAPMSQADRAAQFSAFAALTGFDGVIRETGRLTDHKVELDETEKLAINQVLQDVLQTPGEQPILCVTWFCPDDRKNGGAFLNYRGKLKKVDMLERMLIFTDGAKIPIDALCQMEKG